MKNTIKSDNYKLYIDFMDICMSDDLDKVTTFINIHKNIDIHKDNDNIMRILCQSGQHKIFEFLCNHMIKNKDMLNIHQDNEYFLRTSGLNECIELLDFLYKLTSCIRVMDDIIFYTACQNNAIQVVRWLQKHCDDYKVTINNDKITGHLKSDAMIHVFKIINDTVEYKIHPLTEKIKIHDPVNVNIQIEEYEKNMNDSTYYDCEKKKSFINKDIRISKISTNKITSSIDNLSKIISDTEVIDINSQYDFIKYETGGHFSKHIDLPKIINAKEYNNTIILFPPQLIEGGHLIIYDHNETIETTDSTGTTDTKNKKFVIKMTPDHWNIVIFPAGIYHESIQVTKGTKILLKGVCSISKKQNEHIKTNTKKNIDENDYMHCIADNFNYGMNNFNYENDHDDEDYVSNLFD